MSSGQAFIAPTRPAWRTVLVLVCLVVAASTSTSCSLGRQGVEDVVEKEEQGTFFEVPDPLPAGAPGTLIRSERLLGAPDGSRAWRVLYRSTDLRGAAIAVSGIVVAPNGPAPKGGRPVVSWGHPTTGASGRCAPSVAVDPFLLVEGLHELLAEGYVVAATDYSGMGAAGPPSYLIGETEGRNVLDAVRAARHLKGPRAGTATLLWGHSQGGQAALFAAQMAQDYAPELDVEGVAVAAPAAELGELLDDDIGEVSGVTIGAYAFDAFQRVYAPDHPGLSLSSVLTPAGVDAVPEMVPLCLLSQNKELHAIATPLVGRFVTSNPAKTEPWETFLAENTPGGSPIEVPVLVTQGDADQLVKPATTAAFVRKLCAAGETVQFRTFERVSHATVAYRSLPLLLRFFAARIARTEPTATCPS